jgi:putative transposase
MPILPLPSSYSPPDFSITLRIYPTREQEEVLNRTLDSARQLYNVLLEQRRMLWSDHRFSISKYEQSRQFTQMKKEFPAYQRIADAVWRDVLLRCEKAYQAFFRRMRRKEKSGYPRFQGRSRYNSFTFPDQRG